MYRRAVQIATDSRNKFKAELILGQNLKNSLGIDQCPRANSTIEIAQYFEQMAQLRQEVMIAGSVDCKCRLLSWCVLAVGACDRMIVRIGDAFLGAILSEGSGIFLIHNHPSGSLEPSKEDFEFTRSVAEASILIGYSLLDHVIISKKGCRSLMTPEMLKHRRNSVSVTAGILREANTKPSARVRWRCGHCKKWNVDVITNGVQSHASEQCKPVVCAKCREFTWLSAKNC